VGLTTVQLKYKHIKLLYCFKDLNVLFTKVNITIRVMQQAAVEKLKSRYIIPVNDANRMEIF